MFFAKALKEGVVGPVADQDATEPFYTYKNGEYQLIKIKDKPYYEKNSNVFELTEYAGWVASTASGDLIGTNGKSALEGKTVSAKVVACIPAGDTLTRFSDVSGLGHNLQVEAANASAFSNADYFTTTAAVNGGLTIPQADILWNPYRESAIFSVVFKRATPAANEVIFALSYAVAGMQGFYISHRTNGKLWPIPVKNNGALVSSHSESALQFTTTTAADVLVTVAYDALTGTWYLWKGRTLSDIYTGLTAPGGANSFTDVVSNAGLRVGNQFNNTTACVSVQGYGLQFSKFAGGLPNNLGAIVNRLADSPRQPISALEW